MILKSLSVYNFLGINKVNLNFSKPVQLICGANESGKSSLVDALNLVLTGVLNRTSTNGFGGYCYSELINNDSDMAEIHIRKDDRDCRIKLQRGIDYDGVRRMDIGYVLGQRPLSSMKRLDGFKLLSKSLDNDWNLQSLSKRLYRLVTNKDIVDRLLTDDIDVFDFDEIRARAKAMRMLCEYSWRELTGSDYSILDAVNWKPEYVEPVSVKDYSFGIEKCEEEIAELQQQYDLLTIAKNQMSCPHCDEKVAIKNGKLIPVYATPDIDDDIKELRHQLNIVSIRKGELESDEQRQREKIKAHEQYDEKLRRSISLKAELVGLDNIIDHLSQDGIPKSIITDVIEPINKRLEISSKETGWKLTKITQDLMITCGDMPYWCLSESLKWRADAMISEALSYIFELNFIVLDRIDVLDLPSRTVLVKWISKLADLGDIRMCLLFGTLKAIPSGLPKNVESHWLQNGEICNEKK